MIMPSDKVYRETKQIMLGKKQIPFEFKPLAQWIDNTYNVRTINIYYDTFDKEKKPRVEICFEHPSERELFDGKDGYNFDSGKQKAIANKFKETLRKQGLAKKNGLLGFFEKSVKTKYDVENVWVIYGDFKSTAKIEANESIPEEEVENLKKKINNPDIWEISRVFSGTTFFLYTDKKVKEYKNSAQHKEWAKRYFEILSKYDKFDYYEKDTFSVLLDSKENFDNNYESNWYYYYK